MGCGGLLFEGERLLNVFTLKGVLIYGGGIVTGAYSGICDKLGKVSDAFFFFLVHKYFYLYLITFLKYKWVSRRALWFYIRTRLKCLLSLFLSHSTKVLGVDNASKNSKYVKSFNKVYSR